MEQEGEPSRLTRRGVLVAAGASVAACASGTALGQEDESDADNGTTGGDEDETGGETVEISVIDNEFDPAEVAIEPGTTVQWIWDGENQHNVNPTEQPDGADWEGHTELQASGEYEHTFDVEGEYHYVCDPHVALGMEGDITVAEGASQAAEGPAQLVPDAAWTLVIATTAGMVSVLSLAYAFLRFGGSSS